MGRKAKYSIDKIEDIRKDLEVICKDRGIDFIDFVGEWNQGRTLIKLSCPTHGEWETTNLSNMLGLGYGCSLCRKRSVSLKTRVTDEEATLKFNKDGKFPTHVFERDLTNKSKHQTFDKWLVKCTVCQEDEFTRAGLCTGIFTSTTTHLRSGKVPCRCSKSYRFKEDEIKYLVTKACDEKHSSVCYGSGRVNKSSKITVTCPEGHEVKTTVSKFLIPDRRCNECRKLGVVWYGYYSNRLTNEDYLYILEYNNFIKIGRSFNPISRITSFKGKSGGDIKEVTVYKGLHKDVFEIEQHLLKNRVVLVEWTTETTTLDEKPSIKCIIEDNLFKGKLKTTNISI